MVNPQEWWSVVPYRWRSWGSAQKRTWCFLLGNKVQSINWWQKCVFLSELMYVSPVTFLMLDHFEFSRFQNTPAMILRFRPAIASVKRKHISYDIEHCQGSTGLYILYCMRLLLILCIIQIIHFRFPSLGQNNDIDFYVYASDSLAVSCSSFVSGQHHRAMLCMLKSCRIINARLSQMQAG